MRNSGFATFKFRCWPKKATPETAVSQVEHVALRGACAPIQSTSYPMGMDHYPLLNGKSRRGKSIDSYSFCDIRCLPETLS